MSDFFDNNESGMSPDLDIPMNDTDEQLPEEELSDSEYDELLGKENAEEEGMADLLDQPEYDPNQDLPKNADYYFVKDKDGRWKKVQKKKPVKKEKKASRLSLEEDSLKEETNFNEPSLYEESDGSYVSTSHEEQTNPFSDLVPKEEPHLVQHADEPPDLQDLYSQEKMQEYVRVRSRADLDSKPYSMRPELPAEPSQMESHSQEDSFTGGWTEDSIVRGADVLVHETHHAASEVLSHETASKDISREEVYSDEKMSGIPDVYTVPEGMCFGRSPQERAKEHEKAAFEKQASAEEAAKINIASSFSSEPSGLKNPYGFESEEKPDSSIRPEEMLLFTGKEKRSHDTEAFAEVQKMARDLISSDEQSLNDLSICRDKAKNDFDLAQKSFQKADQAEQNAYTEVLSARTALDQAQAAYQKALRSYRAAGSLAFDSSFEAARKAYTEADERVRSATATHEDTQKVVAKMRQDLIKKEGDFGQALSDYNETEKSSLFTRRQVSYIQDDNGFLKNGQNGSSKRIIRELMSRSDNAEVRELAFKKILNKTDLARLNMLTKDSATAEGLSNSDRMLLRAFRECNQTGLRSQGMMMNGILGAGQVGNSLIVSQVQQQFRQAVHAQGEDTDEERARQDVMSSVRSITRLNDKLGVSGLFGASLYYSDQNYKIGYAASFIDKHLGSTDRISFGDGFTRASLISRLEDAEGKSLKLTAKQRKAIQLYGTVGGSLADSRNILMAMMNPSLTSDVLGIYKKDALGNFILDQKGGKILSRRGKKMSEYVNNPNRFLYSTSPKLSALMFRKALFASKNQLVRNMATLDFRHHAGQSLKTLDEFIKQAERTGVSNHDLQLLKAYRHTQQRAIISRARMAKVGQLTSALTHSMIRSNEDLAESVRQAQQALGLANATYALARSGIHFVSGAGNVIWSSRASRFVRRKIASTKPAQAVISAVSTAKKTVHDVSLKQVASVQKKAATLNTSVVHHVTNNSIVKEGVKHAKSTLDIVSESKIGKAASAVNRGAKKAGGAVRDAHRGLHSIMGSVAETISKPFRAIGDGIQKLFDVGRKVKLIICAVILVIFLFCFLSFMALSVGLGALIGGGTATQTQTIVSDDSFMKELVNRIKEKDTKKLSEAQKMGNEKPKDDTAADDHVLKHYGWGCTVINGKAQKGDSSNQYKLTDDGKLVTRNPNYNTGYYIRYVTKAGFDEIDNVDGDYSKLENMDPGSSNAKQIFAVATTMFENQGIDRHKDEYQQLVDDLYQYMAPFDPDDPAYYRESHLMTNDDEPDKNNDYVDGAADDEFTYYCNDTNEDYETLKRIVETGGAVYTDDGKASLQEPTDEGCEEVLDDDGNSTGEYYCPGHTYKVCYGHKILNIFIPLWSTDDVVYIKDESGSYAAEHPDEYEFQNPDSKPQKGTQEYKDFIRDHGEDEYEAYGSHYGYRPSEAKDILPDDFESKSYYPYIKDFLERGGWDSVTFRQMVQNLSQQSWYEDLYYSGDSSSFDDRSKSLFSVRGTFSDDEIEQLMEDNGYEDVDAMRQALVTDALSMVGRIPYYFGGGQYLKSRDLDTNGFGSPVSRSDPYYLYNLGHGRTVKGLDCSSFIRFELWRVLGDSGKDMIHTTADCPGTEFYSHSQLKPGDLGMEYPRGSLSQGTANHIGIYVGRKNGKDLWVHCAGSTGVVCNSFGGFSVYYRIFD